MNRLAGKVAIITGGGSGLGLKTMELFYRHGCRIVCADISPQTSDVIENIKKERTTVMGQLTPGEIVFQSTDISQEKDCQHMVQKAIDTYGQLDIMVNNAGIMHSDDSDAVHTSPSVWKQTFDINVNGVFYGCKYGIPAMLKGSGGSIINVASVVAMRGSATSQLAYTSSKGAVLSMTQELAVIHAKEGIRVNALCPGPMKTNLLMKFLDTNAKLQRRLVHIPYGRFAQASEVAQAALFLASEESEYVTGHKMVVDGGLTSAYVTPE